eukprot:2997716-Amphidinium_carterae.3
MVKEFRGDLATLLQEYQVREQFWRLMFSTHVFTLLQVELIESACSMCISGDNMDSVASARRTLCQMLQFYLPEDVGSIPLPEQPDPIDLKSI